MLANEKNRGYIYCFLLTLFAASCEAAVNPSGSGPFDDSGVPSGIEVVHVQSDSIEFDNLTIRTFMTAIICSILSRCTAKSSKNIFHEASVRAAEVLYAVILDCINNIIMYVYIAYMVILIYNNHNKNIIIKGGIYII